MEWSWCGSTLFSPSQFLVLWSYNISSPPPSPWQRHIAFFPSSFFKVTFSPSHSSLWAIGTICHYLWSWRHVFFSCLQPNPTISSSFLTSLSPPSHLLSSTLSPTQQESHPISLSQCVSAYLSVYLRCYFGVACPCLAGSSHGHVRTCPSSEATRLQRHILHTDFTSSHMEPTYGRHL